MGTLPKGGRIDAAGQCLLARQAALPAKDDFREPTHGGEPRAPGRPDGETGRVLLHVWAGGGGTRHRQGPEVRHGQGWRGRRDGRRRLAGRDEEIWPLFAGVVLSPGRLDSTTSCWACTQLLDTFALQRFAFDFLAWLWQLILASRCTHTVDNRSIFLALLSPLNKRQEEIFRIMALRSFRAGSR